MDYIILTAIGVVAIALVFFLRKYSHTDPADKATDTPQDEGRNHVPPATCCGAHEVCEAETLLTLTDEIIYYDDEELDRFRGKAADDYADTEIDEFREILLTLQAHEVAGWLRSLNLRRIEPPSDIRDEALMVVSECRDERRANAEEAKKKSS